MLSYLPWLALGSTTNWTPCLGSTDSLGSTGSTSDGLVTIMHECDACISEMPWIMQECYGMNNEWHNMQDL